MADAVVHDVFVIGGGINGCGIARDAAGRGYSVFLAEMNDLASGTSSAAACLQATSANINTGRRQRRCPRGAAQLIADALSDGERPIVPH